MATSARKGTRHYATEPPLAARGCSSAVRASVAALSRRAQNGCVIPTFRERTVEIGALLRAQGALGLILVDLTGLARIEHRFGYSAYQSLREQIDPLMNDVCQPSDVLTRDEREGDRILIFVGATARGSGRFPIAELRRRADHVQDYLAPRVARFATPYQRRRQVLEVGYAFGVLNPLLAEERQVLRLIEDALASARLRRELRERDERERLIDTVHRRDLWTEFQPIVDLHSLDVFAHEALSRGPRGTTLERPAPLFDLAQRYGLMEELEQGCRRQTFIDWDVFGAPGRLFVNTVPATLRDASFLGHGVLESLGSRIPPQLVTFEITEREVIENLTLFRDAMQSFIELGFSFAIDDLGSGHSGLETMARLNVSYLKVDIELVRDVHLRPVNRQVIQAIVEMSKGMEATVIAEGIEKQEEADALIALDVRLGQGYHLALPIDPRKPRSPLPDHAFTPVARIDLGREKR
jgi:EAL domain-containing protein (putative c-di-GMP-specific phosphodiesterase class I)